MKIRHVNIKNIGPFKDFELSFIDGMTEIEELPILDLIAITGENNFGKTLIMNCIVSCLTSTQRSGSYKGAIIKLEEGQEIRVATDYGDFLQTASPVNGEEQEIDHKNRMITYFDSARTIRISTDITKNEARFIPTSFHSSMTATNIKGRGCDRLIAIESQLISIKHQSDEIFAKTLILMNEIISPYYTISARGMKLIAKPENASGSIPINELSDGFRNLLIITGELLCRYITANGSMIRDGSYMTEIRAMPAICLIDDIELHLHPKLQIDVLPRLRKLFPETQFIVSTHAPMVITGINPNGVFRLEHEEKKEFEFTPRGKGDTKPGELKVADHHNSEYRCPENDVMMTLDGCSECDTKSGCDKYERMLDELGKLDEV